nr:reverse transcriptase domain-containing protein [Tanacetum cinerariifolium]
MPPRMRTRSFGLPVAESRGGGTGGWVGRCGGRGRGPRGGNDDHVGNQANIGNQNGSVVNENAQENVGNVLVNGNRIESVQDMSGCSIDQKVKYTAGLLVGKVLTWWNSQTRTLSREVAVSMSRNNFKFMMIEEFCPSHEMQKLESELWNHAMVRAGHGAYTDRFHELARLVPHLVTLESRKIERNGSIKKVEKRGNMKEPSKDKNGRDDNKRTRTGNAFATTANPVEKRGNMKEPSKDKNGRDDNKRTRTGNAFATTTNPVRRENIGAWPKCTTYNSYHAPRGPCSTCFNCNRPGYLVKDRKGVPRNVNHINA